MLHRLLDSISKDSTAELDFNCVEGVLSISCDIVYSAAALSCVVCAALAAGMTMGLLSLDVMKLRIKMVVGNDAEKAAVKKILPLLSHHHYLLCTLLLFNALANEALPIFLDKLVPSWAAVLISVTAVLLFGEIIPTALFTGPEQLSIAARFSPLVYFLEIVFYPIACPMAYLLDLCLGGDEDEMLNREEISAMMTIHAKGMVDKDNDLAVGGDDEETPLSQNEVCVLTGVLALAKKTIRDVYIPLEKVNMLSSEQIFDAATIEAIDKVGHSRLPVFRGSDRFNIAGFFLVKRLINVNPESALPLSSFTLHEPLIVNANQSLLDVLNIFQMGHSHLAIVSENPEEFKDCVKRKVKPTPTCQPLGIVTIEDIFETMIQSQIYDEEDRDKSQHQESASLTLREMSMQMTHKAMMRDLEMAASDYRDPSSFHREEANESSNVMGHGWKEINNDPSRVQKDRRSLFPRAFTDVIFPASGKDKDGSYHSNNSRARKSAENYTSLLHNSNSGRTLNSDGNDLRQSLLSRRSSEGFYSGSDNDGHRDSIGNSRDGNVTKKKITPSLVAKYIRNRSKRGEPAGGGGGTLVEGGGGVGNEATRLKQEDDWIAKAKRAKSHG